MTAPLCDANMQKKKKKEKEKEKEKGKEKEKEKEKETKGLNNCYYSSISSSTGTMFGRILQLLPRSCINLSDS